MKTILYNPIFINPQAYYVFPNLNGQLVEQKDVTIEPAKYSGIIEVKIIANGDIHKIKQFKNTDNIDFTEFSESWVRINQYTLEGNIVLGEWKIGNIEGKPSLDPSIKQSLVGVWIADGKSNTDPDRDIIKNLVDPDNPFVISNAAYTEGSGYADKDSSYYGAFVTDGVNDMIVSQNTVEEMGITDEFTVVSMIHQITLRGATAAALTNYIRQPIGYDYVRNHVANIGKTGIYGYAVYDVNHSNANNSHVINTILGDKNDYSIHITGNLSQGKFSVQGYINGDNNIVELSKVAWYWTFIAKRALTTDEINQIIAYYNLDKYVKPDIYYDVKKQGLTNDNHAQFGDKLIDYSGNGRDLQLFDIGWNPGSGIGKYVTNFGIWSKDAESKISYNSYSFTVNGSLKRTWLMWYVTKLPSFKIKVSGINSNGYVDYGYYDNDSLKNFRLDKDGIYTLPPSGASSNGHGFKVNDTNLDWTGLVIEQIPSYEGALCFDGVEDYGQFVGDLGLKDYTVAVDRAYPSIIKDAVPVVSGLINNGATPFIFEYVYDNVRPYSFGEYTDLSIALELDRKISYQSTYNYNGVSISKGEQIDTGKGITIGRYGEDRQYANIVLWSFLLFPYTLSEFLLERQLKKHKLGTLYPGMVEFRSTINNKVNVKDVGRRDN